MEHFRNHHERRSLIGQAQWRGSDSERPAAGSPEGGSDRAPTSRLILCQDRQMDRTSQPGAIPQYLHQRTEGLELNSPQRHEGHKDKTTKARSASKDFSSALARPRAVYFWESHDGPKCSNHS